MAFEEGRKGSKLGVMARGVSAVGQLGSELNPCLRSSLPWAFATVILIVVA